MACVAPCELVNAGWTNAQNYASSAFNSALGFLDTIADNTLIVPPMASVGYVSPSFTTNFAAPVAPTRPDMTFSVPDAPSVPVLNGVAALSVDMEVPKFLGSFPTLVYPSIPAALDADVPGQAPSISEVELPATPTITLPAVPSLAALTLPDTPTITLPEFQGAAPLDDLVAPSAAFNFTEQAYESSLLTALQERLLDGVTNGGTGMSAAVEQAMWDRERAREDANAVRAEKEAVRTFAARGFSLPPGAMQEAIDEAVQAAQNNIATASRDIAIKRAEMEVAFVQFALGTALQLETQLLNYASQVQQRAFEVQKAVLQAGVDVFNAEVNMYNARVQAYSTYNQIYKTQIEAELSKLEIFKAQLEGQRLISDINMQDIELYKANIQALLSVFEVYRTEMEGARLRVEYDKARLDVFRTQVDAFGAQVGAKAQEYNAYASGIQGEIAKVTAFQTQAEAFNAEIGAYRSLVEAKKAEKEVEFSINRERLDTYTARLEGYKAALASEGERIRTLATAYDADSRMYSAISGVSESSARLAQTDAQLQMENAKNAITFSLEQGRVNLSVAQENAKLLAESARAGATVSAQLTASALSAVNLSGSVSGSDSTSTSYSYSF